MILGMDDIKLSVYFPNVIMPSVARKERQSPISYIAPGENVSITRIEIKREVSE